MAGQFCPVREKDGYLTTRGPFLEAPGNYRAREALLFSIPDGSFNRFKNGTVKLSAKETKWTSLEVKTHSTFLETDFKI